MIVNPKQKSLKEMDADAIKHKASNFIDDITEELKIAYLEERLAASHYA